MKPIHITISQKRPLIIIPDSQAHADGHAILTYTYCMYRYKQNGERNQVFNKETNLHLPVNNARIIRATLLLSSPVACSLTRLTGQPNYQAMK